jgi:LEA14-like dessication related protein
VVRRPTGWTQPAYQPSARTHTFAPERPKLGLQQWNAVCTTPQAYRVGQRRSTVAKGTAMRRMERSALMIALSAGLITTACLNKVVRQPEINLTNVKLGGIGLRGGQIIAELEIKNPNSFDVETRNITYDLKVSDRGPDNEERWVDFAKGVVEKEIKVDDGGTTRVEIPIDFTFSAASGAIRSIMDRGTFDYQVEGVVALREPLRRDIPYKRRGNISLQGVR